MKQHNLRTTPHHKMLQNQTGKSEPKSSQENDEHHSIQELKLMNNETQFLFKKQERTARQRAKDSLPQPKHHNQSSSRPPTGSALYTLKKNEMFSEKLSSSDRLTVKQQYEQIRAIQKGKRQNKLQKSTIACIDLVPEGASNNIQKQIQKRNKKQTKLGKKNEKEKEKVAHWGPSGDRGGERPAEEQRGALSNQLLQLFRAKYGYYLIDNKISYPIEDHLFLDHPELQEQRTGVLISPERLITPLPDTFSKELQIWNMIVEHAAFFELDEDVTIDSVAAILSDPHSPQYARLFKNMHKFYINDVIFQKYEEATGEDYFSFISLWRYAEENSFLDKLFHTSWNKFLLFYISLQRHYINPQIVSELQNFECILSAQLSSGLFAVPQHYSELLDYLIFLVNMCFETHTFKSLINNKMLFFRDNNKMKNELLEEKKYVENRLWELKEAEKQAVKREKTNSKMLKKEQKQHDEDKLQELQKENQDIFDEKNRIAAEREKLLLKVIEIDNKIYELCCLPEFSNVWLLGEDKHRNLYWFIREQESAIYRECRKTGEWGMIEFENIELFHQQLNLRGIKEHKLYEKILYYKQLGYIKIEREESVLAHTPKSNPLSSSSSPARPSPANGRTLQECTDFERFSYMEFRQVTPAVVKQMILKSESMMSKYLFERNSKWTAEENRQEYIAKITHHDLQDYESLSQELRTFNEKICVVEINIRVTNEESAEVESKTRKIQTKIWGINEKYKHFWYDYSRRCRTLSDLHFLVSVLYLTIEKYVTKTRKPNNTKYFFKTVELGDNPQEQHDHFPDEELL